LRKKVDLAVDLQPGRGILPLMIRHLRVSVPGKIILMGEHAAVYDRAALVAALGVRAEVSILETDGGGLTLELSSLGHVEESAWGDVVGYRDRKREAWDRYAAAPDSERFREVRGSDPAHIVKIGLGETVRSLDAPEIRPARVRIDSEIPIGSGFGSSAAVAVGVVAAALRFLGVKPELEQIATLAMAVERCQHGHPSGVDHTAVLAGGILRFESAGDGSRAVRPLVKPDWVGRDFRVFNSGAPKESTGEVVAAVGERRSRDSAAFEVLLDRMEGNVRRFERSLEKDEAEGSGLRAAIVDFESCLETIGVVPMPIRRAVRRLEGAGGAAKISGAGALSGDSAGCLLVYWPPSARGEPADLLKECSPLGAAIGAPGLRLEEVA
jgi:mevalonate kinase